MVRDLSIIPAVIMPDIRALFADYNYRMTNIIDVKMKPNLCLSENTIL